MPQTMRVKLNSTVRQEPGLAVDGARPLFQPMPDVVLGSTDKGDELAVPVQPSPTSLFGPRGGAILDDGSVWVADTGHHRLLGWNKTDLSDGDPAEIIIGQPDLYSEGRNGKAEVSGHSLNVPTGVASCGNGVAVADAWNHRILIWLEKPQSNNQPADIVLGQDNFTSAEANRGSDSPTDTSLFWCYGVHWDGERLWVADTGNRRVLMWNGLPKTNGQPADLVLGQADFTVRDENGGGEPDARSVRWPHAIALIDGRLCVTDAGNNRVMIWNKLPSSDNQPCDIVLGQKDFVSVDHNQGNYFPIESGLNMPYGIATVGDWLIAADTASSRIVGWHADTFAINASAQLLAGQFTFQDKGDNRWQSPVRDSLCWPYNVYANGERVLVADSGNNRVSLWRVSDEVRDSLS